jgi:deazaflavin-dependent oxidoreductase (nitroreductase family)
MSFDTTAGTRGGRQPRTGPLLRLVNKNAASRFRRTGKMFGFNGLILTTVGAKSGAERTSPVGWWPGRDGSWLIVAAANGAAGNPAWYHNIAANPDKVQIEVDGRKISVTAEQLHGAHRAAAWRQIAASAPRFAQYQDKTDRELPVIRLVRNQEAPVAPPLIP